MDLHCRGISNEEQKVVLKVIRASIEGTPSLRESARHELKELIQSIKARMKEKVLIIEACTDLNYGIGVDSMRALVDTTIRNVYS